MITRSAAMMCIITQTLLSYPISQNDYTNGNNLVCLYTCNLPVIIQDYGIEYIIEDYTLCVIYSLSPGFWQSFISIEVCRDCIPALASSCKKQLMGFFVCLLFSLKVKRIS